MEKKIYEEQKKKERETATRQMKVLGIIDDNAKVEDDIPHKNTDMLEILSKIGLIEKNKENLDKLNEFNEYLFKLGIETGIHNGRQLGIHAIKNGEVEFEELMDLDPESFTDYNFRPHIETRSR